MHVFEDFQSKKFVLFFQLLLTRYLGMNHFSSLREKSFVKLAWYLNCVEFSECFTTRCGFPYQGHPKGVGWSILVLFLDYFMRHLQAKRSFYSILGNSSKWFSMFMLKSVVHWTIGGYSTPNTQHFTTLFTSRVQIRFNRCIIIEFILIVCQLSKFYLKIWPKFPLLAKVYHHES